MKIAGVWGVIQCNFVCRQTFRRDLPLVSSEYTITSVSICSTRILCGRGAVLTDFSWLFSVSPGRCQYSCWLARIVCPIIGSVIWILSLITAKWLSCDSSLLCAWRHDVAGSDVKTVLLSLRSAFPANLISKSCSSPPSRGIYKDMFHTHLDQRTVIWIHLKSLSFLWSLTFSRWFKDRTLGCDAVYSDTF